MQNFRVEGAGLVFLRSASGRFDRPIITKPLKVPGWPWSTMGRGLMRSDILCFLEGLRLEGSRVTV